MNGRKTTRMMTPHDYARAGAVAGFAIGEKALTLPVEKRPAALAAARRTFLSDEWFQGDKITDDEVKLAGDAFEMAITERLAAAAEKRAVHPIMIDGVAITPETPLRD
jgi:hypothetical protein